MKRLWFQFAVVLAVLLIMGGLRFSYESKISMEMRADDLLPPKIDLADRNSMGQAGYAAALGGFRDVLAAYFYLKAHNDSSARDFYEMERNFNTVVSLQPRSPYYWYMSGYYLWGSTYNLTQNNYKIPPLERRRRCAEYLQRAQDFFNRGLKNNPHSFAIAIDQIRLFKNHFREPDSDRALELTENLLRNAKMNKNEELQSWSEYVYSLSSVGGKQAQALKEARDLFGYTSAGMRVPAQRVLIYILQDTMMIDPTKKIAESSLLFDFAMIKELVESYNFKIKVGKSSEGALLQLYKDLVGQWDSVLDWFERTDVLRAKLYFLQQHLQLAESEKIPMVQLFSSNAHRAYVSGILDYRGEIEANSADYKAYARTLSKKFQSGEASRAEKDVLALLMALNGSHLGGIELPEIEQLGYTKLTKYKLLYLYWKARNGLAKAVLEGGKKRLNEMLVGNVVRQIRILEEQLNVPEQFWIKNSDVYTRMPY